MKKSKPIVWFEIYVDDMARAQRFYETVMGVTLEDLSDPTDMSMQMKSFPGDMDSYGANGTLVKMDGMKAGGNSTIIYFDSEDCTTEEQRVEKAGGKVQQPKMSIGEYGFISHLYDTEGNLVGLHSMK